MELEYEGELQGADRIARELISAAAGDTFFHRAGGADLEDIVAHFEEGAALQVADDASAEACLKGFGSVPGLLEVVASTGLAGNGASAGKRAAACELVLEALVAGRRISRNDGGRYGRARHEGKGGGGGMKFGGFEG
jgi:magnesium chelatase subunit I